MIGRNTRSTRPDTRTFMAGGAGVLLMAWLMVPAAPSTPAAGGCELSFEPEYVQTSTDSITVQAVPSEEVDDYDGVDVDEESGLEVSLIPDRPLHLLVDATNSQVGEWAVSLINGETSVCTGQLSVRDAGH